MGLAPAALDEEGRRASAGRAPAEDGQQAGRTSQVALRNLRVAGGNEISRLEKYDEIYCKELRSDCIVRLDRRLYT